MGETFADVSLNMKEQTRGFPKKLEFGNFYRKLCPCITQTLALCLPCARLIAEAKENIKTLWKQ